MPVEQRIRISMLIEKIQENREYSEKLGLEETSRFHGEKIVIKRGEKELC